MEHTVSEFNHIMLDLETLDVAGSAVVVSLGAIAFDPFTKLTGDTIYLEFSDDLAEQQKRGRTISASTVQWWLKQGKDVQLALMSKDDIAEPPPEMRVSTVDGLGKFADFISQNGAHNALLWGNGADFDNVVLGSLYEDFGMRKPWSYSRNRCFRTMKSLSRELKHGAARPPRSGTHHNALDDAVTQAIHLQEIYACLRTPR